MNATRTFRVVDTKVGFNIILFLCFFTFGLKTPKDGCSLLIIGLWAFVSSIVSYFALDALNYFEAFKPLPRKTNFLNLILVLPWGALLVNFVLAIIVGHGIVRHRAVFTAVPFAALLGLVYQYISGFIFIKKKIKRNLWPLLDEKDFKELKSEFQNQGYDKYFQWINSPAQNTPDLIVISRSGVKDFQTNSDLLHAHLNAIPIVDMRTLISELRGRIIIESTDLWHYLQTASQQIGLPQLYFELKSLIEPIFAILLGLILLPFFLLTALLVKFSGPGAIFFKQKRTGYQGKTFTLYKFRTMKDETEGTSVKWAGADQERITPIGNFLRLSHLDEIPQLLNIIKGDLSFVGPRPERPEFYEILKPSIPLFYLRTLVRPGVTGWAQIKGGYASSVEESKKKLEYDLYYMQHMSLRFDITVLIKTFLIFLHFGDTKAK